jgi:hypothetical protein
MTEYRELEKALHTLPVTAWDELLSFVRYLEFKYQRDLRDPVVKLGGLWADVDFDVSDEDVRALRHRLTDQLADKV